MSPVATVITSAPKGGRGPYAFRRVSVERYRIKLVTAVRGLDLPECAWTVVTRSDTEIVLKPIS